MPGPYPLDTLAPTINELGITSPTFEDILRSWQASMRAIYGSDLTLDPDTQDGQWLAVLSQAYYDFNQALITGYFSFSPSFAVGVGLSSLVRINGLERHTATNSTAILRIVGQVGTTITNGAVNDQGGNTWLLPATVTIPMAGEIMVTATAQNAGAITAPAGTITNMLTQNPGWQSVSNPLPAVPGQPVETDAQLRARQRVSTSLPAITPREAIEAAVWNLPGVTRAWVYENDTDWYDSDWLAPHSIAVVVEGGDINQIARAIALKKNPGTGTQGDISVITLDSKGIPKTINFFPLQSTQIYVEVTIQPLASYQIETPALIKVAIAEFINSLDITLNTLYLAWLCAPAELSGAAAERGTGMSATTLARIGSGYVRISTRMGLDPNNLGTDDITLTFREAFASSPDNVTVIIPPEYFR